MKPRPWLALMACALAGCAALNSSALGEVVVGSALYLGSAAHEYRPHGCPADCPTGRLCNPDTGFCERPPCEHRCLLDEQCVRDAQGERCEPAPPAPAP